MIQADSDPVILDAVDKEIIELLRRDGRMSFAEISKRLDLPETTARYRVQRLLQTEAIQIIALRNQERLGMPYTANITLVVENERVNSVVGKLTCMEEVRYLAITAGRYNVFVEVCFGEYADFLAFLPNSNN